MPSVTMLSRTILFLLILQTAITRALAGPSQCYFTNGTETDSSYKPCFPDEPNSACCVLNKPNDAPNDVCLDNGLCYSQDTVYSGVIFMDACTDQKWGSTDCPRYCQTLNSKSLPLLYSSPSRPCRYARYAR